MPDRSADYRRERWKRADWSLDARRDCVIAALAGLLSLPYVLTNQLSLPENVWIPVLSIIGAVVLYESARFAWRFVFTAPREIYLESLNASAAVTQERDEAIELAKSRPRPLIRAKYLAVGRMSIQNKAQPLWFDNIGQENAFNITVDDVHIGKALVQFRRIDSLTKDHGTDKPILKGYLDGRPFGTDEPHSERILETAIYMTVMNVGTAPESDLQSEFNVINQVIHSAIHAEGAVHEWGPLVIHYEDARGVQYHSRYLIRLTEPDWELSLIHVESPMPPS